jgi:DNA invertase Pin-like site-specific DNA recombinase
VPPPKHRRRRAKPGDPSRAVAYVRVSTDRQDLGPDAQRAAIESWARREGVAVLSWHEDRITGSEGLEGRPALRDALLALRPHRAGLLVVAKRDRLARDVVVAASIEAEAKKSGAVVASAAGEGGTGGDPMSVVMRRFADVFAEHEKNLIRQRTRDALQQKRRRGERAGKVPFGYAADERGRLSPNEGEREVVALVRRLRGEGLSLRAVVDRLRIDGRLSRAGTPFQLTQVAHMAHMTFEDEGKGSEGA